LLIVRRRHAHATVLAAEGTLSGADHLQSLLPPADKGETRARGALVLQQPVAGSTQGAHDGFDTPCVAQGGSPDEGFRFKAPHTASYAFELQSEFDGALAVLADSGEVLACNDDRHGHEKSSLVHIALEQGAEVRVVVDGFAGDRGTYRLLASEDRPLEHGGVLMLGGRVAGDTRGAADDHSEGCYAPAGDEEWKLTIDQPGTYRFTLQSPSFHPTLLILGPDDSTRVLTCGLGRDNRLEVELSEGTWTVVVDGHEPGREGPYTLQAERVDRPPRP
jgi:hypothetical protein